MKCHHSVVVVRFIRKKPMKTIAFIGFCVVEWGGDRTPKLITMYTTELLPVF